MHAGIEAQKAWGCPVGCHEPLKQLSPAQQESLEAVGNLTGADCSECTTCPRADLHHINNKGEVNQFARDIESTINARLWRDKGQLQLLVGPDPQNTLVEAIECLDHADIQRHNYDVRKANEKAEADRKRQEESSAPTVRSRIRG